MMTPEQFIDDPWKERSAHPAYRESFLNMRPAPEYASGEVVMASVYRNVGFGGTVSEGKVPQFGRDLGKRLERTQRSDPESCVDANTWRNIISGPLSSPKQPNQTSRRFLQICPIVPDAAIYSLSARLSANSWNPGELVSKLICFGEADEAVASTTWKALFDALSVGHDDDVWARFLQAQFQSWRSPGMRDAWQRPSSVEYPPTIGEWHRGAKARIPAGQFVRDLSHVLRIKHLLTRRQWISLLESLLRLGTASHVLWLCRANSESFRALDGVLRGQPPPTLAELNDGVSIQSPFWRYGQLAARTIKDSARDFVIARVGLSLLLWHWDELRSTNTHLPPATISSVASIVNFAEQLAEQRNNFPATRYFDNLRAALEEDPRVVACRGGISSNITEFLRHVLGQRQTSEPGMDSYDQGYFLRKRGSHSSAPWIFALGPVSVLTLTHCCTSSGRGLRTVEDLCRHLGRYGIEIRGQDVAHSDLGQSLRNLGLVVDSPDAEGGMVLVNPLTDQGKDEFEG
jgi:hypothetical protein